MTLGALAVDLARNVLFTRLTLTTPRATTTLHWSGGCDTPTSR